MKDKMFYWSLKELSLNNEPATLEELKKFVKANHKDFEIDLEEIKEKENLSDNDYNELKKYIQELRV